MDQEKRTQHGHGSPRADIVVWESAEARAAGAAALMVVETKAAAGPVIESDFRQGASYASAGQAGFLIAATATAHAVFEMTPGFPGKATQINDWPRRQDFAQASRLEELRQSLRVFDRDEFQKLLAECHDLLRDHHAMTPEKAFDTISKILFIKLSVERSGRVGTFTTRYLDERRRLQINDDVPVHDELFEQTKQAYKADDLFARTDRLDISPATFRAIVEKLERFNLSKTGDDIKGIAFEQFLGRTFRGELGQFFTPRPVVEFMVDALDPQEGELICDPAAGSGGFLIRVFDHVRAAISADIEAQKTAVFEAISAEYPDDADDDALADRDKRIDEAFGELNEALMPTDASGAPIDTRVGRLAWRCIYGTDKEPRAARTAKMNMIMHGDGHGGIHAHDGLVNINGIWDGRFDVIVTNPPFGASVSKSQEVGATKESDVPEDAAYKRRQRERYGDEWLSGHADVVSARGNPVLEMFEIGKGRRSRQTEVLFVERILTLLKPGGRAAVVLPNGVLNATSLEWVRRWAEGRARLDAVVALPTETFKFSQASVSASIVFFTKFTAQDVERWEEAWDSAAAATDADFDKRRDALVSEQTHILLTNNDNRAIDLLAALQEYGVRYEFPHWTRVANGDLVRNAGDTKIGNPRWSGRAAGEAADLRRQYLEVASSFKDESAAAMKRLRTGLAELDAEQTAEMWQHVREHFDYPVFMATPSGVGITATGDTGPHVPDDLPEILESYRRYRSWVAAGAEGDFSG